MAKKSEFSEGKKNIIAGLLEEYDIQTVEDFQEALKDLLGGTIQSMIEAELNEQLGYEKYARSDRKMPEMAQNQRNCEVNTVRSQYLCRRTEIANSSLK